MQRIKRMRGGMCRSVFNEPRSSSAMRLLLMVTRGEGRARRLLQQQRHMMDSRGLVKANKLLKADTCTARRLTPVLGRGGKICWRLSPR